MTKLKSLREYLLSSGLKIQPEDLLISAAKGSVVSHAVREGEADTGAYKIEYAISVLIADFSGDALALFYLINRWVDAHMPGHKPDVVSFAVDLLDADRSDVELRIDAVTDRVSVAHSDEGVSLGVCEQKSPDPIVLISGTTEVVYERN